MISRLLILSILILSLQSINLQGFSSLSYPSECSRNDTEIVKAAALACQNNNYGKSSSCMQEYIRTNYNGQAWGIEIKINDDNPDYTAIWCVTSCIVKLENFGNTYKRTYNAWSIRNYTNSSQAAKQIYANQQQLTLNKLSNRFFENPFQQSHSQPINSFSPHFHLTTNSPSNLGDNCDEWKAETVKNTFQYCDVASNEQTAECIKQRIKDELDEYWGVSVSTTPLSSVIVMYTYCARLFKGYGIYSKTILLWSGF